MAESAFPPAPLGPRDAESPDPIRTKIHPMQESSSGEGRPPRSKSSRSRGGNRNRSRNRGDRQGDGRSRRRSDGPDEFRPSDDAARSSRPRRSKEPPKPTFFQKVMAFLGFGKPEAPVRDKPESREPRAKPARPAPSGSDLPERGSAPARESEGRKRERRAPAYVEPTTPRLYVGNLSFDVDDADLQGLFAAHGSVVLAEVVRRSGTDQSKGFAFVEMGSVDEAKAAATALNDHELKGRKMLVTGAKTSGKADESTRSESRDNEEEEPSRDRRSARSERGDRGDRNGRGGRERRRGGDSDEIDKPTRQVRPLVIETVDSPSLRVENVNAAATETDLADLFDGIGSIANREETGPGKDENTKNHRIDLADTAEAQKAVELLDGKFFMGHQLRVTGASTDSTDSTDSTAPADAPPSTTPSTEG